MIEAYFVIGVGLSVVSLLGLFIAYDELSYSSSYRASFFFLLSAATSWFAWPLVVVGLVVYGLVVFYKKGWCST